MFEEYFPFLPTIFIAIIVLYVIKKSSEVLAALFRSKKIGGNVFKASGRPSDSLPDSFGELLGQMEMGCEAQLSAIAERCRAANITPEQDVGYMTVRDQLAQLRGERPFTVLGLPLNIKHPFTYTVLEIAYGAGRTILPDLMASVKRIMKGVGSGFG